MEWKFEKHQVENAPQKKRKRRKKQEKKVDEWQQYVHVLNVDDMKSTTTTTTTSQDRTRVTANRNTEQQEEDDATTTTTDLLPSVQEDLEQSQQQPDLLLPLDTQNPFSVDDEQGANRPNKEANNNDDKNFSSTNQQQDNDDDTSTFDISLQAPVHRTHILIEEILNKTPEETLRVDPERDFRMALQLNSLQGEQIGDNDQQQQETASNE